MQYSVIFDMDGVLVDSEPVILAAAIAGLAEYGINAKPEDFKPFIGAGEDRFIGGVAEKYGSAYKLEMKTRVYEIYLDLVSSRLYVYEGVKELLSKLKAKGYKMALASSADRIKVDANLSVAGIPADTFSAIVAGEDVERKKPFPDIFLHAADKIQAAACECIVIEDAVNGIKAAKAGGMKCIAITSSFSHEILEREKPDYICRKTADIYAILETLK